MSVKIAHKSKDRHIVLMKSVLHNFDLYVLGDDALICLGSLMQTKHLYVLIHI